MIHREYTNPFPAKLIIEEGKVYTENWNKPHGAGNIDPNNFSPFPKNPMIAKFFKEIGWVDELGSGVRNTFKYCKLYTPETHPEFIEGDIFKAIIPTKSSTTQKTTQKTEGRVLEILIQHPEYGRKQIAEALGDITEDGVKYQLEKLKKSDKIVRIGADKGGYWEVKNLKKPNAA